MKDGKENINLEELFRNKLLKSEVTPGDSVREELMGRLAVKEFMRFNISRFNIYYSGLILAGALTAVILFTTGHQNNNEQGIADTSTKKEVSKVIGTTVNRESQISGEKSSKISSLKTKNNGKRTQRRSDSGNAVKNSGGLSIEGRGNDQVLVPDTLKKKATFADNFSAKGNNLALQETIGAAFDASVSSGCSPLKVKFINRSNSYDSCRWVFGDGGFSTKRDPEWIFDNVGEYKIILSVFNSKGTQATATSIITVNPKPVARFEFTPEKPVIPDDEIRFTNYSVDAVKYKWEFGDGTTSSSFEPYHKYRKYNKYNIRLVVWSDSGCTDTILVKNAFSDSGCYIDFPNAFIPGSDGPVGGYYSAKSDESARIFHPATSGVTEYQLKIFSKLGILLFESNDISIGWDGYMKGQLCEPGVYVWKVRGTYKNGEPFVKMGDVTLIKN